MRTIGRGASTLGCGATPLALILWAWVPLACGGPTPPVDAASVTITLETSGGLAGVDWAYRVDGESEAIVGIRCASVGCDWEAGETIGVVTEEEVLELARAFVDGGFLELDGEDFGTECCDQFHVVLTYRDDRRERSARGTEDALPESVGAQLADLRAFVDQHRD